METLNYFQSLMRKGHPPPNWIRHVGSWNPSDFKSTCPFCSLLINLHAGMSSDLPKQSTELFAFPSHLLYDVADSSIGKSNGASMSVCLLPLYKEHLLVNSFEDDGAWKEWLRRVCDEPFRTISLASGTLPEQPCSSGSTNTRFLQDGTIDYGLIRHWITSCVAQHGGRCAPSNGPPVPRLKLIDCYTRSLISAPTNTQYDYVTLSYVWGKGLPDPYNYPLLPERLPLVIADAMTVVMKLGLRYLWVDRYCIWQNDPTHKISQVNKMDQIYGDAYFTIFACAGDDPNYGLPGVSAAQRKDFQRSGVIGREILVANRSHHGQTERISASAWNSRGWTFQEEALSRRRLYFTDYETSFVCFEMCCFEHLAASLAFSSNKGRHKRPFWNDVNFPFGVWPVISEYSGRQLTYKSDRINAISGVLENWSKLHPNCFHYWSVPIIGTPSCWRLVEDDDSLSVFMQEMNFPFDASDVNNLAFGATILTKAFLAGMYVLPDLHTQKTGARNRDFPSWSWAGQNTKIRFKDAYSRSTNSFAVSTIHFDAEVWIEKPDGTTVGWERFVSEGGCDLPQSKLTPYLHIECWVFKVGPFRQLKRREPLDPIICIPASENYADSQPKRVREFSPDFFHSPASLLFTSDFDAICFEPPERATFALVLDTIDGVLERIGVLNLYMHEIDDGVRQASEPNLEKIDDLYPQASRRRIRLG